MKRILSIALVLVLCLTMLVACGDDKKDGGKDKGKGTTTTTTTAPADDELSVEDVKASLIAQYQTSSGTMIIKEKKEVYAAYMGFPIEWTVEVTEGVADGIAIETIDGKVYITVPETAPEADVFFTAKATITDEAGNSAVAEFKYQVAAAVKDPEADTELSIADALALGGSKSHDQYTSGKYYVTGEISLVDDEYYGNLVITDNNGNNLTIYGSWGPDGKDRIKQLDPMPKAGDTVKLYGIIGMYNDKIQMKNAWIKEINGKKPGKAATTTRPSAEIPSANSTISVKQAIDIALSQEHDKFTKDKFYLTATVTEVYNTEYGNMKVKDSDGNILTIYGSYSSDGKYGYATLKNPPAAGDTVKLYGALGQYNEAAQMKNAWIMEVNSKKPEVDPAKTTAASYNKATIVTNPEVGVAYKFALDQTTKGSLYFFTGAMSGYYGATDTNVDKAVDVYVESASGGYKLYFKDASGSKKYIKLEQSGTHYNFTFGSEGSVFTFNEEKDAFCAPCGDQTNCFIGTYGNYVTFGVLTPGKMSDSDYIARLYKVEK